MLFLLAFFVIVSADVSANDAALFKAWMTSNNKVYQSAEELAYRQQVFADNAAFVRNWDATKRGFTVALNAFADLTVKEFASIYNGMNITKDPGHAPALMIEVPASVDWRQEGAVTAVKNQGQCGSCWSFSATGSMEGAWKISGKPLTSLSEQNLVDCSTSQGNMGCNGGLMDYAFQYVISNNGIDTEASYPYQARGPLQCRFVRADVGTAIKSFVDVSSGSEAALQVAVAQQPTSVAIDAGHSSFQLYHQGVYYEPQCSATQLDHGVLAIGYGVDATSGNAYWLVKNSWGANWGMSGYILMSRNRGNNCGIATAASYPVI
jgi:cathepsin L